jgi:magnesium chelatase family protein
MNPCPCGHAGDPTHPCICPAADILRYRARLSGPLADRIDLHVTVPAVPLADLATRSVECSSTVRARVESARALQHARYAGEGCNARAPGRWLETHGDVEAAARQLLATAGDRLHLSARAFHRVLRVARTIADVESARTVGTSHMAEALAYRPRVPDASALASATA